MTSDHRIVVSKVLWEQRKVLGFKVKVNARWQIANMQRVKMGNTFLAKFREEDYYDLYFFYKKNLGEDSFALGMEIHWDKRKGVLELSQRAY